jgi:predicted membrane protein
MGFLLIGIGNYFLLPDMYGFPQPDVYTLWPVLLIFLGLMIVLHQLFPSKKHREFRFRPEVTESSDHMEHTLILGGEFKKINSFDFSGGKITSILAGSEIDLTNCCLSKGVNEIEITAVLGGVSLTVPKEWNIKTKIVPIMGGVFDEIRMMPDAYVDPAAEITIKGVAVMGGIEIKRA